MTSSVRKRPPFLNRSGAALIAAGILVSRVMGLVRQRIFAHYFGNSDAGDAFNAALKIPNFPQNLFGDGVLSASFIPVYANLLGRSEGKEADRIAGIIGSFLAVINAVIVLLGVWLAPQFIDLVAPGFTGEKRALTIHLVQIFFPGTGLLVMSAWCLGILNSHRRFFLSYASPVAWNLAIIAALLIYGSRADGSIADQSILAVHVAWAVVVGSALQFLVQVPTVLKVAPHLKAELSTHLPGVRTVFRNFLPVMVSRGVVQMSAYIDSILASLLPVGAVSALAYAQSLYMLPISLFGMSISAVELTAMSRTQGTDTERSAALRGRLEGGLKQIAFFIVPSVVAMLAFGDVIVGGLFQGGAFHREDSVRVWFVLAGSTVGLLATTLGRLYSSAFYSLSDTRTPLRFAIVRVVLTGTLGALFGLYLPTWLGIDRSFGTAGLTLSAGLAGWVEFFLLRRAIGRRIGEARLSVAYLAKLWGSGIVAGAAAVALKYVLARSHPLGVLIVTCALFGGIYFSLSAALGVDQAERVFQKVLRRQSIKPLDR